jgi:hypothetical protein
MSEQRIMERTYRRQNPSRRKLVGVGAAAVAVLLAGCAPSRANNNENTPSSAAPTAATDGRSASPAVPLPTFEAGQYCSDAPADRAKPVRVQDGRLVVEIHGECSGNPSDPVGVYRAPTQQKGPAAAAMGNGLEFSARCIRTDGQFIRTDAAATYHGPYHTGDSIWLVGTPLGMPAVGEVEVPHSNTGFVEFSLGNFTLQNC